MSRSLEQWLTRLETLHPRSIDLGLERCGEVYARLGAPRPAPIVVTVGGTNGKGSTVAWLSALARGGGLRVGTYTSPHLLRFNERLVINGEQVSDARLEAAFAAVEQARGETSLTYFEFTTLACLHIMAAERLDLAVLEVGLGGRLDTVNLVDADVAVLTAIGLDHMDYLGPDRESIGAEKAGIVRAGHPLVCGEAEPPKSVLERARQLSCPVYLPGRDFYWDKVDTRVFHMGDWQAAVPDLPLAGAHQYANLGAALAAARLALPGFRGQLARRSVAGLRHVQLAGRMQRAPGDPRVLLDVGHNPLAAQVLARALQTSPGTRLYCVLGMLRDKDVEAVASALGPKVSAWYCAGLSGPRGQGGATLAARVAAGWPAAIVRSFDTVSAALQQARADCGPADEVLVMGSFETVAQALRVLQAETAGMPAD